MDTKSNDDSGGSDSLDKSMQIKCVMVETEREQQQQQQQQKTEAATSAATAGEKQRNINDTSTASVNSNSNATCTSTTTCSAFETKVKLISQNLKETTLAEAEAEAEVDASAGGDTNSSIEESSSTTTISTLSASASETRLNKKVRFHPDVKENDGGNRVKKKKKTRVSQAAVNVASVEDDTSYPVTNNNNNLSCDGMDFDEYEDDEDEDEDTETEDQDSNNEEKEEEFDMAKTIAEAENYLKQHPLTFVRPAEQNGERLRDGLLNAEDVPQMMVDEEESVEYTDGDFYAHIKPENGIDRILGKETKAGKVEFLLRYENQGGLFWESEEFIRRMCPTLLKAYEKNRERRQQRLMHHVAKRQSLRQRYTDF